MSSQSSPSLWLLLLCRSCGSRMKVRAEAASAGRLLCPGCRAVVPESDIVAAKEKPVTGNGSGAAAPEGKPKASAPEPAAASPAPQARTAAVPPPETVRVAGHNGNAHGAFQTNNRGTVPREEDAGFQSRLRSTSEMETERHVVKKRRKAGHAAPEDLADWNSTSLDFLPEAEMTADEWDRVVGLPEEGERARERSFTVGQGLTPEGEHVKLRKRVRKRRPLAGARLFFMRFTRGARYTIIAIAALIALGGAVFGIKAANESSVTPDLPPVKPEDIKPRDRSILSDYDRQGAREAIEQFMAADSIEKKLQFVRLPERVRPLMEQWYKTNDVGAMNIGQTLLEQKVVDKNGYFITMGMHVLVPSLLVPGTADEVPGFFAVEEILNGTTSTYKVDWEVSMKWQPMPLERLREETPSDPRTFRLKIRHGDYYLHKFADSTKWQCLELFYPAPGAEAHLLYGYVSRTSVKGQQIIDLIGDGDRWTSVQIEIAYPKEVLSRDQVEVLRLIDQSWFIPDPAAAAGGK